MECFVSMSGSSRKSYHTGRQIPQSRFDGCFTVCRAREAIVNHALREGGAPDDRASRQMIDALFSTITNANRRRRRRIAGAGDEKRTDRHG